MSEITYSTRRKLQQAGVPFGQLWDSQGLYLAHWFEHRQAGKKTSVGDACKAAGFSPDALRQRRRHNPEFAAAERWARTGAPYQPPAVEEAFKAVVDGPGKPLSEHPPDDAYWLPPVIPASPGSRRKPRRQGVPMWAGGSGMEHR